MNFMRMLSRHSIEVVLCCFLAIGATAYTTHADPEFCYCPNLGDANGDGAFSILDLVYAFEAVFHSGPVTQDPYAPSRAATGTGMAFWTSRT